MKKVSILALFLVGMFPLSAAADDETLARFKGGIGVDPVSSGAGLNADGTSPNVNRNVVRGVNPPGQIWRIADLRADIKADGRIEVDGRGLLLAGGNNIGRTNNVSVVATLICETVAPFTQRNTDPAGVAVAPDGDFRIDDVLTPPPPADACATPVLLIRNTAPANDPLNRPWFAAGIPKVEGDD